MIQILHNNRCRKSRETLALIQEKAGEVEIIDYLKVPPSREALEKIIHKLGIKPHVLIRKGEKEYKEHYKGQNLTDGEWIDAMIAFPKLIERPIVINGNKAAIGRPPENILPIL